MRTEAPYVATVAMAAALAVILLMPLGCSPPEAVAPAPEPAAALAPTTPLPRPSSPPVEPSSPPDASPTPTTEPQQAKPSTAPAAPLVSTSASPTTSSELEPAATSPPSTTPPSAAPPPAAARPSELQPANGVADPGGEVAVEATRPGLTRVGAARCSVCHKPQFASWSESAHARRKPPLDCESCHGAGSEYKSLPVMKDAERAKAAGLVLPNATFCATCHRQDWNDDQLRKAHAHKEPPKP